MRARLQNGDGSRIEWRAQRQRRSDDQHHPARSGQEGAAPERLFRTVDARRGGGRRRAAEPDPLSLRLQAGDGAGAVRISERAAARSAERAVRRPDAQAVGAMGPGLRLSRRRYRVGLRARAAGADRRELGRRRGRQGGPRRHHGMGRSHRRRRAQGRARSSAASARSRPRRSAAFAANAFIGAESLYLLGLEKKGSPVRQALRRVGDLIRHCGRWLNRRGDVMRAKLPSQGGLRRTRRREAPLRDLRRRRRDDGVPAALEHRPLAHLQGAIAVFQRALPLHRL